MHHRDAENAQILCELRVPVVYVSAASSGTAKVDFENSCAISLLGIKRRKMGVVM
jgi:hypothetical protein